MKKVFFLFMIIVILANIYVYSDDSKTKPLFTVEKQEGGIVPCLLSAFDLRLGYMANENSVGVYPEDFLSAAVFLTPIPFLGWAAGALSIVAHLYYAYTGYNRGKDVESACIGFTGWKTANMMDRSRGRMVEWLAFIPFINLYSVFVIISETTSGKTWSSVMKEEKLGR